jgi:hypothetical protein
MSFVELQLTMLCCIKFEEEKISSYYIHIPLFQKYAYNMISFSTFVDDFPQVTTTTNTERTIVSSVITPSFRLLISIIQGPDGLHFTTKLERRWVSSMIILMVGMQWWHTSVFRMCVEKIYSAQNLFYIKICADYIENVIIYFQLHW